MAVNWNEWLGFLTFQPTLLEALLMKIDSTILALFTGNQLGKTATVMHYVVKVIGGMLPISYHNILPEDTVRTIRLASESLPIDKDGGESKNTLYPALKKVLPASWIIKDITARNQVMTIRSPLGGKPVYIEFVSYNQAVQTQSGVQRKLIVLDELAPFAFYEEQLPRLLAANGRMIMMLTSTDANWTYEIIFEHASQIYRTKAVRKAYRDYLDKKVPFCEKTESVEDIAVIQAATDDNPIWAKLVEDGKKKIGPDGIPMFVSDFTVDEYIKKHLKFDDPDTFLMRRYGIFKQISGSIFKEFQWDCHFIPTVKYFPDGIPSHYRIGRFIDYHEGVPAHAVWLALSPENECFVWQCALYSADKWTTLEMGNDLASRTGNYKSHTDLADPWMAKVQQSVGVSVMSDLNRVFSRLKQDGHGTGGFFKSWDTKSLKGRDAVKERLKNAKEVGRPFSNKVIRNGRTEILPTLWIMSEAKQVAEYMRKWRYDEWKDANAKVEKDPKGTPQQKWSHYCMCLEAAFKDPYFKAPHEQGYRPPVHHVPQRNYGTERRTHAL